MAQHHHRPPTRRYQVRSWDGEVLRGRRHSSLPGFLFCLSPIPQFAKPISSKPSSLYLNPGGTQRNRNSVPKHSSSHSLLLPPSPSVPHHHSRPSMALRHRVAPPQDTVASFRGNARRLDAVLPGAIDYYKRLERQFLKEIEPLQFYATEISLNHAWKEKLAYADRNIGDDFLKTQAEKQEARANNNARAPYAYLLTYSNLRNHVADLCADLCEIVFPGDEGQCGFRGAYHVQQTGFKVMTNRQRETAICLQNILRTNAQALSQTLDDIEGNRNLVKQAVLHLETIKNALATYRVGWQAGDEPAGPNNNADANPAPDVNQGGNNW